MGYRYQAGTRQSCLIKSVICALFLVHVPLAANVNVVSESVVSRLWGMRPEE